LGRWLRALLLRGGFSLLALETNFCGFATCEPFASRCASIQQSSLQ
jgi:hypothetical protein